VQYLLCEREREDRERRERGRVRERKGLSLSAGLELLLWAALRISVSNGCSVM
jgi:hypothetical protein